MSRQSSLEAYFKVSKVTMSPSVSKSNTNHENNTVAVKRSLSLKKPVTPNKSPKVKVEDKPPSAIVELCSDDEETAPKFSQPAEEERIEARPVNPSKYLMVCVTEIPQSDDTVDLCSDDEESIPSSRQIAQGDTPPIKLENDGSDCDIKPASITNFASPSGSSYGNDVSTTEQSASQFLVKEENTEYNSDSSQATVIYSPPSTPQTPRRTPQGPPSTPHTSYRSPRTPQRSPRTPQLSPHTPQRSPQTLNSFRSPTSAGKYFSPNKKKAVTMKKPVRRNLAQNMADCVEDNELFNEACLGMDDKTIFLLNIINKCICNPLLYRLLDEKSQCLLTKAMRVAKPGMRLVCRLYWYKEGWYKLDKASSILSDVNRPIDDPTMHQALNSLVESGFLTLAGLEGNPLNFDDYTEILSAVELKQICKDLKLKSTGSKQEAIAVLKGCSRAKSIDNFFSGRTSNNSARVLKIMSAKAGPCYKLSDQARKTIYDLYILMYLGINYNVIREKTLELLLLYDKINREPYPVEAEMLDDASVVFSERAQFESYVNAHNTYEEYLVETESIKKCDMVTKTFDDFKNIKHSEVLRFKSLPIWLRRFTPLHMYVKILETGVQELKKEKRFGLALEILEALIQQDMCRQHKKADWYAEKALVLHKCGQAEEAAKVLLEGFKSDMSEEAKDVMRPRAKIFAKQKSLGLDELVRSELLEYATKDAIMENTLRGVHVYKQPMDRTKQKGKLKFETRTQGERIVQDVEEYCLSHYISSGEFTDGMHWEGRIVTTIFFLLFWDIIYWKPPKCVGVFLTRFQRYPLDLFCESFYDNRKESIEARLALIERCSNEEVLEIMRVKWEERPEGEQSGVGRDGARPRWEHVRGAARCLPPRALAALCRRLVLDYRHSHSGFPDLTLWNTETGQVCVWCSLSIITGEQSAAAALCRQLVLDYRHAHSGFPDLTLWNTETGQIRFVEVKSDTDKPSMKQIQWMHYLQRHGIDTEFCYVGVNTTRSKARPVC